MATEQPEEYHKNHMDARGQDPLHMDARTLQPYAGVMKV